MKKMLCAVCAAAAILLAPAVSFACENPNVPCDHAAPAKAAGPYDHAMQMMHQDMNAAPVTGDADVDFVNGMIPHHQGAIDMAKVVLEKGKDPEIKKLADGIVKAQESEIKMMKDWLSVHSKK